MIYILGWSFTYLAIFMWYFVTRNRILLLLPLLILGLIIALRYSGTDTYPIYEISLRTILESQSDKEAVNYFEPGFMLLASLALFLTNSSEVLALRLIGLVFIAALVAFLLRADKTELYFLFLYFVPVFIYQYGMNAVRAGLAMALLLLAWQSARRGKRWEFILLSLVSVSFHYSAILPAFLFSLVLLNLRKSGLVLFLAASSLALSLIFLLEKEHFLSKLELYMNYTSPEAFSGTSRLFLTVILWFSFIQGKVPGRVRLQTFVLTVGIALFSQVLAFFSYAGLRLLELVSFYAPMQLINFYDRMRIKRLPKVFSVGMAIAGLLGCIFAYRNFLSDYEGQLTGSPTPFLPYRTIFDYKP